MFSNLKKYLNPNKEKKHSLSLNLYRNNREDKKFSTTLSRGLDRYISMSIGSGEESILSSSCFCRLSATAWMAFVHSSLPKTRKSCRGNSNFTVLFCSVRVKKIYFRELEECFHEFKLNSRRCTVYCLLLNTTYQPFLWGLNMKSAFNNSSPLQAPNNKSVCLRSLCLHQLTFWENTRERKSVFCYFGVLRWS